MIGMATNSQWKASLPTVLAMYLLAEIRAASRASEPICSYSSDTITTCSGKAMTEAFLLPRSKILILASGTPRLNLDLG